MGVCVCCASSCAHAVFASSTALVYPRLKWGIRVADSHDVRLPTTATPYPSITTTATSLLASDPSTVKTIGQIDCEPVFSSTVVYSPNALVDWKAYVGSDGTAGAMVQQQVAASIKVEMSLITKLNALTGMQNRTRTAPASIVGVGITIN